MKTIFLLGLMLLAGLMLAAGAQAAEPAAVAGQYSNPVIRGVNPDPSICRVGEDYYLATSSFFYFPGVPIYHSKDLVNWRIIGHALTRPNQFSKDPSKAELNIYAPTLRHHDGTFYLITTNIAGGGNFYVTAQNPAGPWSDPIWVDAPMFDPSLFFDDDGKIYYTRRGPFSTKDIVQAEIDVATGKLLGPLQSVGRGYVSNDSEGPHLFKRGDYYYLTLGEGGSRALHMQCIGRSTSPWGPFEACPHNPVIEQHNAWWHPLQSLGHADFLTDHLGNDWVVFLGTRHPSYDAFAHLGRETFLAPVQWVDGWPVVAQQALRSLDVQTTQLLPASPWPPAPAREEFNAPRPGLDWLYLCFPDEKMITQAERPGFLRLRGAAARLRQGTQTAYLGRRQQDLDCTAMTRLEFNPTAGNEEAGLTVFQVHNYHYDLFRTVRDGKPVVALRKTVGDIVTETDMVTVAEGPVELKIEATPQEYRFFCRQGGGEWQAAGSALTRLIATEVAAVWSGVTLGLYASGNGQPCAGPADFDWFEYQGRPTQYDKFE